MFEVWEGDLLLYTVDAEYEAWYLIKEHFGVEE